VAWKVTTLALPLLLIPAAYAQDVRPTRVCFAVTLQCFGGVRTTDGTRLDLSAPPITKILPSNELLTVLPDPDELRLDEPLVKVEGERGVPVNVPVGIMSLPWAMRHPTQFWRIFLPSPSRMTSKDD
jgi:hypothetical protein